MILVLLSSFCVYCVVSLLLSHYTHMSYSFISIILSLFPPISLFLLYSLLLGYLYWSFIPVSSLISKSHYFCLYLCSRILPYHFPFPTDSIDGLVRLFPPNTPRSSQWQLNRYSQIYTQQSFTMIHYRLLHNYYSITIRLQPMYQYRGCSPAS